MRVGEERGGEGTRVRLEEKGIGVVIQLVAGSNIAVFYLYSFYCVPIWSSRKKTR